ncbi:HAD-IC family P-type ATPase [Rhodobacterales bacterium HKCCSP123]|nr:HAD-IC family P-type ATPase [Rhodobacterales bacterium HKCCSP123]
MQADRDPRSSQPHGLSAPEVAAARAAHGWNELPEGKPVSPVTVLWRQVSGLLVLMLIGAAAIALALGEVVDAIAIGAVVILNAALGFVQEWRAERAIRSLKAMMSPQAVVMREGREQVIPARELVPGDVILLAEGDRVPADAEILAEAGLGLDEAVLTGESVPVSKPAGAAIFGGTTVTRGHAEARVTRIGAATEFGQVAELTGTVKTAETSLQRELGHLARQLGWIALAVAAVVAGMGAWRGLEAMQVFMLGLSMAVAMVPEGLPAVVTVTLALGAGAMARRQALVRHLQAVETLGAASVICTDKTGTLTENAMTVRRLWTAAGDYVVSGSGYDPTGHFERDGEKRRASDDPVIARASEVALACTHARLRREGDGWRALGDPTEAALIVMAHKAWAEAPDRNAVIAELPFTSDRKRMSVLLGDGDGNRILTKGAPELVIELCTRIETGDGPLPLTPDRAEGARAAAHAMAEDGMRVIALARRPTTGDRITEEDLTLIGLAGLIDPPRAEVAEAIAAAQSAGIRTLMITGDHPETARAIAAALGLPAARVVTGPEIEAMDEAALSDTVAGEVAFARVSPAHKLRIIAALQAKGETVGMTGDGVNDAPALRKADIGIAMGIRGTEVAKDAADLVLLDDNYATIVGAIAEGRRQFDNTRKFVRYLLSSNAGEVLALLINTAMLAPLIFLPTQILWMNLVTDGVTAVALGLEPGEKAQMKDPPRPRTERILSLTSATLILGLGLYTGLASLWIFETLLPSGTDLARTAAFTAMVVFEKTSVFAFRSLRTPGWKLGYLSNPALLIAFATMMAAQLAAVYWAPLQTLLQTVPLRLSDWALIAGFALPLLILPELWKSLRRTG